MQARLWHKTILQMLLIAPGSPLSTCKHKQKKRNGKEHCGQKAVVRSSRISCNVSGWRVSGRGHFVGKPHFVGSTNSELRHESTWVIQSKTPMFVDINLPELSSELPSSEAAVLASLSCRTQEVAFMLTAASPLVFVASTFATESPSAILGFFDKRSEDIAMSADATKNPRLSYPELLQVQK